MYWYLHSKAILQDGDRRAIELSVGKVELKYSLFRVLWTEI